MSATITLTGVPESKERSELVATLREDIDLYQGTQSKHGEPTWTLHDPLRNSFFSIGWLEYELLKRWDYSDPDLIAQHTRAATTLDATIDDVQVLNGFLQRNELVSSDTNEQMDLLLEKRMRRKPGVWSFVLHRYLFFRIPLLHPDAFLSATLPLVSPVFSRGFRHLLMVACIIAMFLAVRQWSAFSQSFELFTSLQGVFYFAVALVFSKCLHELGHAYTCKRYGLRVPTMGIAFLVMWPFLYTDTTESWKLASRHKRLMIGIAGMYVEISLAIFATILWSVLADGALKDAVFFLATASWLMTLAINLNPFMRWDGYYILSDILGIQNLQPRSFALGKWYLREVLFGLGEPPSEIQDQRTSRIMIGYAYCTWVYRFVLFLGIALLVYYFFFKALGLFLMAVELVWFIGRPLYAEAKEWYARGEQIKWNRHTILTLTALAVILALLAVPWQTHISAPAVMEPDLHKTLFAATPGRISRVHVEPNQSVQKGDMLFEIRSPELEYRFRDSRNQIRLYQASLSRYGARDYLEQREVVLEKLAEAASELEGYRNQLRRLKIKAPFDGKIVMLDENLVAGRWISDQLSLATLINNDAMTVSAYVSEEDLDLILSHKEAHFYAEDPVIEPIRLTIRDIDRGSTQSLSRSVLSSSYGGPIKVIESEEDFAVPQKSVYRIQLGIPQGEVSEQRAFLRGTVHFPTEPKSGLARLWSNIQGILIRESSF